MVAAQRQSGDDGVGGTTRTMEPAAVISHDAILALRVGSIFI